MLEVTQLMGNSIHFNYDISHFLFKMVDDMIKARQLKDWFGYCSEFVNLAAAFVTHQSGEVRQ